MDSVDFLNTIGVLCTDISQVKVGDVVGRINVPGNNPENTVRLYYVERITLDCPPPWFMPRVPFAYFKAPHIGLVVKKGEVKRHYVHTPMPGESYTTSWGDYTKMSPEEREEWSKDEDFKDLVQAFDMYVITDPQYIKLGQLIPKVEVPNWSILAQTSYGGGEEDKIYKFVESVEADLETAHQIYKRVKFKTFL